MKPKSTAKDSYRDHQEKETHRLAPLLEEEAALSPVAYEKSESSLIYNTKGYIEQDTIKFWMKMENSPYKKSSGPNTMIRKSYNQSHDKVNEKI